MKKSKEQITIAYLYYSFYPVIGGASVHGYNLARELAGLDYRLLKINGEPDPFTEKRSRSLAGLRSVLRESDLVYVRLDYFLKPRNLLGFYLLFSSGKTVVELNSPSDELHLFGRGRRYIQAVDKIYSWILKRAAAVIVVSEQVKEYCETALALDNVHLIENGGEIFSGELPKPRPALEQKVTELRHKYEKLVIWAGTPNEVHNLKWIEEIITGMKEEAVFLMICSEPDKGPAAEMSSAAEGINGDQREKEIFIEEGNKVIIRNPPRADVQYLLTQADIGLAFYNDYPWSRWGFYNSSLKIFEYLNNGLLTITNTTGSSVQNSAPGFRKVETPAQVIREIRSFGQKPESLQPVRSWSDVAIETDEIFKKILAGNRTVR